MTFRIHTPAPPTQKKTQTYALAWIRDRNKWLENLPLHSRDRANDVSPHHITDSSVSVTGQNISVIPKIPLQRLETWIQ